MKRSALKMAVGPAAPTRFLSILDFGPAQLSACLARAAELKAARAAHRRHEQPLEGLHVALLFEKPSLRTRSTFQIAVRELGGHTIEPPEDVALGGRESIGDVARNLERWVAAAVVRTFAQSRLEAFADAAPQAQGRQRADRRGASVPGAGRLPDAHRTAGKPARPHDRVCRRRQQRRGVARAGRSHAWRVVRIASPKGFELPSSVQESIARCATSGGRLELTTDPAAAVRGADAVYTDVWTSMGQEAQGRRSASDLRAVPGQRRPHVARRVRRALHALPPGAPGR